MIQFDYELGDQHELQVLSLTLSKDETYLISGSPDTVVLWQKIYGKWEFVKKLTQKQDFRLILQTNFNFCFNFVIKIPFESIQQKPINSMTSQRLKIKIDLKEQILLSNYFHLFIIREDRSLF
ncbi:hypothetical protein FGO68_gene3389 [Halteria grandinella]|uniref:Uncharacterized protein n=1 Tax=Halteria grandinella TaxID=5974 RepID=A0A8J8SXK3_HALGN|nr:hypothetical protein FGO68_gene3389 [Halteria grandinella]